MLHSVNSRVVHTMVTMLTLKFMLHKIDHNTALTKEK